MHQPRRFGEQVTLQMLMHLHALDFTILPCPNGLIFRAAELKARNPITCAGTFDPPRQPSVQPAW